MKKYFVFALTCVAGLAIVTACGNGNSGNSNDKSTGKDDAGAQVETAAKDVKDMVGIEQAEYWLNQTFSLTLADVKPAFEYEALEKGMDGCMGNSGGGVISFVKKDGTPITEDEFKAYVTKIYPQVQKCSPTGKIHKGQGKNKNNSEEVQQQELTLGDIDFSQSVDLSFPKQEDFVGYWHHVRIYNKTGEKPYISVRFN